MQPNETRKQAKIKVLIVDDESVSLQQSKEKIELYVPANQIYVASNSIEVMRIIKSVPIDLAFLDVEMPDTDGFAVADYLAEHQPKAKYVFLTGHVELGAKSYDYEPLDFLCKPMDAMRLQKTFERFERSRSKETHREEKIAIEMTTGFVMVRPSDIAYITRENRKSMIYCNKEQFVAKNTLDELEVIFSDFDIFRCHQSYLIPLGRIKSVKQSEFGRSYYAVLDSAEKIPVSRGKYVELREAIAGYASRVV